MKLELWQDEDVAIGFAFCFAGPMGDEARASLAPGAKLIWTVEADNHFDAMTKYHEFMGWGEYKIPPDWEDAKDPYPLEWIKTQKDPGD